MRLTVQIAHSSLYLGLGVRTGPTATTIARETTRVNTCPPKTIDARRAMYRAVSRKWHEFLGFASRQVLGRRRRRFISDSESDGEWSKVIKKSSRNYRSRGGA